MEKYRKVSCYYSGINENMVYCEHLVSASESAVERIES